MEDWMMWALWAPLGFISLMTGAWNLVAVIRHERKGTHQERGAYEARPLLSDDKMAVLRSGDTVLTLLPVDGITVDQHARLIDSMKALIAPARERGIEFIAIPDCGQRTIVISREEVPDDLRARTEAIGEECAAADIELEDVRMPGPCLPPPPNPRPNPPDSGLDDEQWAQFLAKQRAETVQIDPAKTYKECFFNHGVFMALEAAFRSPEPLYSRDSQEYREMVRAFWHLADYFGDFWPDDEASSDG